MGLSSNSLSVVSAGIDFLTLTSTNPQTKKAMWRYFNQIVATDLILGHKIVPGGAYGFYGKRARHGLLAAKEERSMLQVSGQAAQHTFKLIRSGDNCTRIDVQVTVRVPGGDVPSTLAKMAAEARGAPAVRGIRPKVKTIEGDHGTETVYIGKRSSDIYIRLYDKFEESKKEEYRGCVRLEVEVKGKASKALWEKMASDGLGPGYLLSVLRGLLERRGVCVDWVSWPGKSKAIPFKEKTSQETTRAWWAVQVAPSVARDVASGSWIMPFRILFEKCLTELDMQCILGELGLVWGN